MKPMAFDEALELAQIVSIRVPATAYHIVLHQYAPGFDVTCHRASEAIMSFIDGHIEPKKKN